MKIPPVSTAVLLLVMGLSAPNSSAFIVAPRYLHLVHHQALVALQNPPITSAISSRHFSLTSSSRSRLTSRRFASINSDNENSNENTSTSTATNPKEDNIFLTLYKLFNETTGRQDKHFLESSTFFLTPLLVSIVSFLLYPTTSILFHKFVNAVSQNNWEPVDGGQLQWSILLPALNGVVMTAISLLYANLISTTGTQLRNRQIIVHSSLSQEIEGLRALLQLVPYYPEHCREYFANHCLQGYLEVLTSEIDPERQNNSNVDELRSDSPPLSDYRNGLHSLGMMMDDNGNGNDNNGNTIINGNILERSYETLQRISNARTTRVTSLQTKFPQLHYVTITALTLSILFIFLLETDRKIILYLDKFQIRSVWALLVGTVTAIYCIGIDLAQPFIGTYTVPAEQLLEDNEELMGLILGATSSISTITAEAATAAATTSSSVQLWDDTTLAAAATAMTPPQQLFSTVPQQPFVPPPPMLPPPTTPYEYNTEPTETQGSSFESFADQQQSSKNAEPAADGGMSMYDEYMRGRNSNSNTNQY